MKTLIDSTNALIGGLTAIRRQFGVPDQFPPAVLAAAESAARRAPTAHVDRTDRPFVTLDPATSTDLDQAFTIESSGSDLMLHYAIADVAWFVADGDAVDREAWQRGTTIYLPDGKAGLYPPVLAEGAASLLPAVERPAVIFTTRIDASGNARLDGAERAVVRSTAKLAYDSVAAQDLPPGFDELARRIEAAESRRGAARVDPPGKSMRSETAAINCSSARGCAARSRTPPCPWPAMSRSRRHSWRPGPACSGSCRSRTRRRSSVCARLRAR
jgi:hypothetical protein